jgi:hypothetical protein
MGCGMTTPAPRKPLSAGIALAILPIAGAVGGGFLGQPSAGLLAGIAAGIAIALLFWWIDRKR